MSSDWQCLKTEMVVGVLTQHCFHLTFRTSNVVASTLWPLEFPIEISLQNGGIVACFQEVIGEMLLHVKYVQLN